MTMKPQSSDTLSAPPVVLKPWNRMADARIVDVEKKT
jgi:hypothetical protein